MPSYAPVPESQQGGGSTVAAVDVLAFADLLRAKPDAAVQSDDHEAFHVLDDEPKSYKARKRTGSAGGRMREKVAETLAIPEDAVSVAVRAVESENGKPQAFRYWLSLTAQGIAAVREATPTEAGSTEAKTDSNGEGEEG